MLEKLKEIVCAANKELASRGIVLYTWGNVSGIDCEKGVIVIKPSGVPYEIMKPDDMVVIDLLSGEKIEGEYRPSSDTPTHLEIYRAFPEIGGIVHTHSIHAVAFAQAGMDIPAIGTTHADYFYGDIPCTRSLSESETISDYEANTGKVIVQTMQERNINPLVNPGILVCNHGPFAFGKDAAEAVHNAVVLETIAEMDLKTMMLNPQATMSQYILEKHYSRKHGKNAYYGQNAAVRKNKLI